MTTLASLNPFFLTRLDETSCEGHDRLAEADGVVMDCPGCRRHRALFWSDKVPASAFPGPERHLFSGSGLDDLTVERKGAPHLIVRCPCQWTGHIVDGVVTAACALGAFATSSARALPLE